MKGHKLSVSYQVRSSEGRLTISRCRPFLVVPPVRFEENLRLAHQSWPVSTAEIRTSALIAEVEYNSESFCTLTTECQLHGVG